MDGDFRGGFMKKLIFQLMLAICAALVLPSAAMAQATRTWISGVGDDANPCSRTAPCKTFAGAISKTAATGEIDCLDPGGFGAVTITKAITLNCLGMGNGGILVAATNGITINAGATDHIVIRGLDIEGLSTIGGSLSGINFIAGGSLVVEDTEIRGFPVAGITFAPSTAATLTLIDVKITTSNSSAANNEGGLVIRPTGVGPTIFSVVRSDITNGRYGIVADGSATTGKISGLVRDSNVSGNSQSGILTNNVAAQAINVTIMVDGTSVIGNGLGNAGSGLRAFGPSSGMLVSNSSIFANQSGVVTSGGAVIVSYGNNRLNGNSGADGAFSSTILLK
jgi:hypothetical protein